MNKVGCALKLDTAPLSRRDILLASLAALTRAQARSRIRLGCQTRAYGSPLKNRSELAPSRTSAASVSCSAGTSRELSRAGNALPRAGNQTLFTQPRA